MSDVALLPCLDDDDRAAVCRRDILIPRERAAWLARETIAIVREGAYHSVAGRVVEIGSAVEAARQATVSIAADTPLPVSPSPRFEGMGIQVANETATAAARRLVDRRRTIVLNFANGFTPGGGFLQGARAQEESLCRASALYETIRHDAMYELHIRRGDAGASDHAILSPEVPFFRDETGALVDLPVQLAVLTCAAPMAMEVGRQRAAELLSRRIDRVLGIMAAYRFDGLVLGAWGCGAFHNDAQTTAVDFRRALLGPFRGAFREVVFAVADWSEERRTLGPFRDAFLA